MTLINIFLTLTLLTFSIDVDFVSSADQSANKLIPRIEKVSSRASIEVKTFPQKDKDFLLQEETLSRNFQDKEFLKIENMPPGEFESKAKQPETLVDEKSKENFEKEVDHSTTHDSSLGLVINFIKHNRDEPTTLEASYENSNVSNINEVNLKDTALKLHEIIPDKKIKNEIESEEGRSHSINIASLVDKLLNQMERTKIHKVSAQVAKLSMKNGTLEKHSPGKENSKESELPSSVKTSQPESFVNVKVNESDPTANDHLSEHSDAFEDIIDKLMVIINQYNKSNVTLPPNDTAQQVMNSSEITNALLDHLNKIFHSEDKNVVSKDHQSLLVPALKRPINKVNNVDTESPLDELKSIKDYRTELHPDQNILEVGSDEEENFKETVFTYILDKVRERLSEKRSSVPQKSNDNLPSESVVSNSGGKTTIFIYPQSKAEANQTDVGKLKLDMFANTDNAPPFYTILNGQVIGSINLDSFLKSNSLKSEHVPKNFRSSDVDDKDGHEETVVEEPFAKPKYRLPENISPQKLKFETSKCVRSENVREVTNDNKIGKINDFIGFLKVIQEKLDSSKPKYKLKSGGFDLSSLKVISNSNQGIDAKIVSVQHKREVNDSGISETNLPFFKRPDFKVDKNVKTYSEPLVEDPKLSRPLGEDQKLSRPLGEDHKLSEPLGENLKLLGTLEEDPKLSGLLGEDHKLPGALGEHYTFSKPLEEAHKLTGSFGEGSDSVEDNDYSTESEELYRSRSSDILTRNEQISIDRPNPNIEELTNQSNLNTTSGVNELNSSFNKRSEDLGDILDSISKRIFVRSAGKQRKKNKRRKNKVNIRQGENLSTANCQCGRPSHTRIVGGRGTSISKHPWIAQLVKRNGKPFCGGTLINDRFVLTAAHCLKGKKAEDLLIKMGSSTSNDGTSIPVKRLILHEQYLPSKVTLYDIALVEIEEPFYEYTSTIKPICLPIADVRSQDMRKGIIAGFGSMSENGQQSDTLQEARVIVMESSTCGQNYKYSQDQLNPLVLCAKEDNVDSCQGDSGGPLIRKIGNYHVQLGVTSWGIGCAREEFPGIYTKVSSYMSWIESLTYEAVYCQSSVSFHRQVVKSPIINGSGAEEDYKIMNEFIANVARQLRDKDKVLLRDDEVGEFSISEAETSQFVPDSLKDLTQEDTFELIHG